MTALTSARDQLSGRFEPALLEVTRQHQVCDEAQMNSVALGLQLTGVLALGDE